MISAEREAAKDGSPPQRPADRFGCRSTLHCLFGLNKLAGQLQALGVLQALGSSVPRLRGGWEEWEGAGALHSWPSDAWVAAAWGIAPEAGAHSSLYSLLPNPVGM